MEIRFVVGMTDDSWQYTVTDHGYESLINHHGQAQVTAKMLFHG